MKAQSNFEVLTKNFAKTFGGFTEEIQSCIDICLLCHKTCEEIIPYCLEKGGTHAERKHIELLLTCSDICRTSAHSMMWHSEFKEKVCELCSDICAKCAEDCERMSADQTMRLCAEICRECEQSCRKMAAKH